MSLAFLVGMLWKSAAIAGIALLLLKFLKSQAAAERAAVLRVAIVVLLALPLIALAAPAFRVAVLPPEPVAAPIASVVLPIDESPALRPSAQPPVVTEGATWDNPGPLVEILYLGGAALILMRLAVGLWTLRRWTNNADPVTDPDWLTAFDKMRLAYGASPRTRLLETYDCGSPLSWGFRRPVILIDCDRIHHAEDAEAILAHEFAHITRRDWLMLMLMHVCTAIFWFNPLVWMLEREAIQQAEEAADAQALRATEPAHYAQMLLSYAEFAMPRIPANCMAPEGGVARRVKAILAHGLSVARPKRRWAWMAMLACVGIAGPISAMKFVAAEQAKHDPQPTPKSIASPEWAATAGIAHALPPSSPSPVIAPKEVAWAHVGDDRALIETPPSPPAPVVPVAAPAPMAAPAPVAPPAPAAAIARATAFAMSQTDFESYEAIREARRDADRVRREAEREATRAAARDRDQAARDRVQADRDRVQADRDREQAQRDGDQARRDAEQARRDGEQHRREAEQAKREAEQTRREAEREAAEAVREAQRDAEEARREALREGEEARREAIREASAAVRESGFSMHRQLASLGAEIAAGVSQGLRGGAVGMEEGARTMELEASKLRDPAYRKQQIEEQARHGHRVTDQELVNAIPKMQQGAKRMREGAQRMREGEARSKQGQLRMATGATQMQRGADRMIESAQRMRETAANLRRTDYRRQRIAEAATRGETVTEAQLLRAIPGLESGAVSMEREAARMRKSADELARS